MICHLRTIRLVWEATGVEVARKHIGWYLKTLPAIGQSRIQLMQTETARGSLHARQLCFDASHAHTRSSRNRSLIARLELRFGIPLGGGKPNMGRSKIQGSQRARFLATVGAHHALRTMTAEALEAN